MTEKNEILEESPSLKDYSVIPSLKFDKIGLETMTLTEKLALRDQIDTLLPRTSLKDFNLEKELILQFLQAKELQNNAKSLDGVPMNQRAQLANSLKGLLSDITRLQHAIYNAEQYRLMEAALAKALKSLPKEAQEVFFKLYCKTAEDMASA